MPYITPNDIQSIYDFDSLLDFLREKLGWHIPEDVEFEDVAYPLTAEDLDLDELTQDRIGDYYQLPPFPPSQPTLGIFEDTQPWGIFFLQFNSEDIYRTALRRVLRGLVERRDRDSSLPTWEHDHLLFICTTTDFQRFAFAHFASNENWRRAVLSIFSWEQGDTHIRTLCEYNLPALTFPSDGFSNDQEWLQEWQKAFDVEEVTDKFFADYQRVFAQVEAAVEGIPEDDPEARRLYTQRLFNRLMFLRFIEKKGWLTYNGTHNYLRALFNAVDRAENENTTYMIRGGGMLVGHREHRFLYLKASSMIASFGLSFTVLVTQRIYLKSRLRLLHVVEKFHFSTVDSLRCRNTISVMLSTSQTTNLPKS